jgi:hypothetical protein
VPPLGEPSVPEPIENVFEDPSKPVDVIAGVANATTEPFRREVAEAARRTRFTGATGRSEVGKSR